MSRAGQRSMKGMTACQRCRRRKQKCDQKFPSCSNCESAHVQCLTYHSGKQVDIPRNYVSDLEAHIEKLTQENQELRLRTPVSQVTEQDNIITSPHSSLGRESGNFTVERQTASNESPSDFQNLVSSVRNVVVEPSRDSRFLGQSSGISFARLVMAAIHTDTLPQPMVLEPRNYETSLSTPAKASLPPRHVADHLVDIYFQYRTPHLPIVDRSRVDEALESVYMDKIPEQPSERALEMDIFTTYMIFAIALCDVNVAGGRPSQSEGCFSSALGWVEKVLTYSKSDVENLRAVLLLAQFVALYPTRGSLWHLTGFALRMCIDIGLHWESEEASINIKPDLLNDRRCLWYSAYQLDRVLCITLGRPFSILDESTRVQLPNPWARSRQTLGNQSNTFDIHNQRAHNHLFTMAKLESEIRHAQQSQSWSLKLASPRINYSVWIQDIQPRLAEWHATIPELGKAHSSSIFASQAYWDVIYNNAVFLLYRPHSSALRQSMNELLAFFEASCKIISSLKILQRDGKVEMLWKSVHHLFMAGLGVTYGLWHSKEIRDRFPIGSSISTLQSCSSTLAAMSQTFTGAAGCRDAFESLSSATVDWLVTKDIEESHHNSLEFEKQVKGLMHQLQLPRDGTTSTNTNGTDNMSAMLSTDSFVLSDMLHAAAQWPAAGEADAINMSIDLTTGSDFTLGTT